MNEATDGTSSHLKQGWNMVTIVTGPGIRNMAGTRSIENGDIENRLRVVVSADHEVGVQEDDRLAAVGRVLVKL